AERHRGQAENDPRRDAGRDPVDGPRRTDDGIRPASAVHRCLSVLCPKKMGRCKPARRSWGLNRTQKTRRHTVAKRNAKRLALLRRKLFYLERRCCRLRTRSASNSGGWGAEKTGARRQTGP